MSLPVALAGAAWAGAAGAIATAPDWHAAWRAYRTAFIDAQGRVIDYSADDGFTTSEGQSYALFFSLVAGDQDLFRRILAWTDTNLAGSRLGDALPAWKWGRRQGGWGVIHRNSAGDADSWIAYALLQAGRLWRDPSMDALGRRLAARIIATETAPIASGRVLLPGQAMFPHAAPLLVNPSYTPLFLAHGIAQATSDPAWQAIARAQPELVAMTASHGFVPDWAWVPGPPAHLPAGMPLTGVGSFDAIRVYLWAGLTATETPGAVAALAALDGMARHLRAHSRPPLRVDVASGGGEGAGPIGFSGALLPYLARLGDQHGLHSQLARIARHREASGLFGPPARYYDENLNLFGLGGLAGVIRFDGSGAVILP